MFPRVSIDVKPKIIQMLVDDLTSGKYYLPSFQRQYVWDADDVKDLIESIVRNYPIGTIILWNPKGDSKSNAVDPFSKPLIDVAANNHSEVFYVIDGQQRLTSLLLLLNDWKIKRDGEDITVGPISYNAATKRFFKSSLRGTNLSQLIKAFYHYDPQAMSQLQRSTPTRIYKEMETLVKNMLNKYPIPVCVMETEKADEQTFQDMDEAFIRINKYGIRIGNLELMLSFLAGTVSGDLKESIRKLYDSLYKDFEIDLQPIIRFVFSNFGLSQTQISKVNQFRANIEKIADAPIASRKSNFEKCSRAMKLTADFLKGATGIVNSRLLPSQIPLVVIGKYFYANDVRSLSTLSRSERANIVNWFVLASFKGFYSSRTDTKLDRDLQTIKAGSFPLTRLLENMETQGSRIKIKRREIERGLTLNVLRSQGRAYLFLLYLLLVGQKADDWNNTLLRECIPANLARHHIFPKEFLEQNLDLEDPDALETQVGNLGNITFIHKDINEEIGNDPPVQYLKNYLDPASQHFISAEKNLWALENYTAFLEDRIAQMHEAGKAQFPDIFD